MYPFVHPSIACLLHCHDTSTLPLFVSTVLTLQQNIGQNMKVCNRSHTTALAAVVACEACLEVLVVVVQLIIFALNISCCISAKEQAAAKAAQQEADQAAAMAMADQLPEAERLAVELMFKQVGQTPMWT